MGSTGANVYTSSRIESTGNDASAITADSVKINGQNYAVTLSATLNSTSNAAKLLADAINTNTLGHGAVATAYNRVVGAEMGPNFDMTASFTVNGITIAIQDDMQGVVDAINQNVQDVNAELGGNNSLILFNDSGIAIDVAGTSTGVGLATDDYEGFYKLENVDGSDVTVELGNLANGYTQATTATAANLAMLGLNETDGAGQLKSMAVSTAVLATTDLIKINGATVGATVIDSAQAKAAAINLVSEESGVVATATTTVFVDLNFDQDATASSFEVNGTAVDVNALNSVSDVAAAINTADVGVVATATSAGLLQLFDAGGGNITIDLTAPTAYVTSVKDADNNDVAIDTANYTVRGNIELVAQDGGHIQLEDGTLTNTGLAKLGLEASSEMEVAGSGGVNVSTLAGATSSLQNIDAAMDKLSGFRASFGAVENRIDAKINNLTTLKVNTQAAQSRIEDADFAAETTNMTKAQILSQAATSMLAQANSSKQNLLALLQG
jgi:flagellin